MTFYYTLYAVFLAFIFVELSPSFRLKKRLMICWSIFFVIYGGIRWNTGGDWDQYYSHFLYSNWNNIFNYDRNGNETLEPGFVFLNALIKSIFKEYYFFNIFTLAVIEYGIYKFCIKFGQNHPWIPFIMFNLGVLFPVRAGLSLGVCYLAFLKIKERKLVQFLIILGIAFLIHNQCIALLPLYWLGKLKIKDCYILVLYVFFAISTALLQDVFILLSLTIGGNVAEKAYMYTQIETEGFKGASYMGWVLNFFFLCVYLYVGKKTKVRDSEWYNLLINGFLVYMLIMFAFQDGMGDLARLSSLYFPVQVILFTNAFCYFTNQARGVYGLLAVCFVVAYFIYKWSGICDGYYFKDNTVPYKTIFDYNMI